MRADPTPIDDHVDEICRRAGHVRGDLHSVVSAQVSAVAPLASPAERATLTARALARLDGLGPLAELLADDGVDEIMVNRGRDVMVDRAGTIEQVGELSPGEIETILERILAPSGRRVDRTSPVVDARLPDGGRLCAVAPPIAVDGIAVTIRHHRTRVVPLDSFGGPDVVDLLRRLVDVRANILVTGATSSGKTTLLAALCREVPARERLIVIEDTTELDLGERHAVRLEARPATVDGPPPIGPDELVRAALRLRPDRLVLGEFRGSEVLAAIQAFNTGHDGSLSTCHANSSVDALRRVETLVMQAAPAWPLAAIRRHVTRSIDAVVHLTRCGAADRAVADIVEVIESDDEPAGRPLVADGRVVAEPERRRR